MIYETAIQERRAANQVLANVAQAAVLVGFGVFLGLILGDAPSVSAVNSALQAGSIAGEDWHGNVRRSGIAR